MSAGQPITKAEQLLRALEGHLGGAEAVHPFTLRGWVRDLEALFEHTPTIMHRAMFHFVGVLRLRLWNYPEAVRAFQSAQAAGPDFASSYGGEGAVYLDTNRPQEALDVLLLAATKTIKEGNFDVVNAGNIAEAYYRLGREDDAAAAFEEMLRLSHMDSPNDLFALATQSAEIGREDDAAEYFARYLSAAQRIDLGTVPAMEVIRAAPASLMIRAEEIPNLIMALRNVETRFDGEIPEEHRIRPPALGSAAWATIREIAARPSQPSSP